MTDDMKIPEYWEGEIYVTLTLDGYNAGKIRGWGTDMTGGSSSDYMAVGQATVRIPLDQSKDPRSAMVESLTERKEEVLAEAHIKAEAIQHKIDDLLQIEYTSED